MSGRGEMNCSIWLCWPIDGWTARMKIAFSLLLGLLGASASGDALAQNVNPLLKEVCERGWGIPRPTRLDQILNAFGKPTESEARVEPNPHVEGKEDEWLALKFPTLSLLVLLVGRDPNHLLMSRADVDSRSRVLPGNLRVGAPSDEFIRVLGPPGKQVEGRLTYYCNDTDEVAVEIRGSRVRGVRWSYYAD